MRTNKMALPVLFVFAAAFILIVVDSSHAIPMCDPAGSMIAKNGICSYAAPTACYLAPHNVAAVTPRFSCMTKDHIISSCTGDFYCDFTINPAGPASLGSLCADQWTMTPGASPLRIPVTAPCIKHGYCVVGLPGTPGGIPPCQSSGTFDSHSQLKITSSACVIPTYPYYGF